MSLIKDLLEITLNRIHLQMSSVAFPVGSRASPCSSLVHPSPLLHPGVADILFRGRELPIAQSIAT